MNHLDVAMYDHVVTECEVVDVAQRISERSHVMTVLFRMHLPPPRMHGFLGQCPTAKPLEVEFV